VKVSNGTALHAFIIAWHVVLIDGSFFQVGFTQLIEMQAEI